VFPPVNVFEDRDGIVIRAEVPGFAPDQIDLSVEPRTLVLKGRRDADQPEGQGSFHRRERQHGSFARSLSLPKGLDADKATAECSHGLLTIRIPKAEAAKPKAIQIKTAA
jgi:HSP20 family protein